MTGLLIAILALALFGGLAFMWEQKPLARAQKTIIQNVKAIRTGNTQVPGINLPVLLQELSEEMGAGTVQKALIQDSRMGQALRIARSKNSAWFLATSATRVSPSAKNRVPMKRNSQTVKVLKQIEATYPAIKKSGGKVFICRQGVYLKKRTGQLIAIA